MTNEEAAKILDPETSLEAYAEREYYGGFNGSLKWREDVNEACKMGALALRAQEKEPCEICSLCPMCGRPLKGE